MRRSQGFTLLELLVVLTILGVMVALAVPSFKTFVAQQRVKSASYELATSLLYARSEAIKRNAQVQVAPNSGGTAWASGWKVQVVSGATNLQVQDTLAGITVTQSNTSGTITFNGTGRPTATGRTYWLIASTVTSSITARCVSLDSAGVSATSNSSSGTSCP